MKHKHLLLAVLILSVSAFAQTTPPGGVMSNSDAFPGSSSTTSMGANWTVPSLGGTWGINNHQAYLVSTGSPQFNLSEFTLVGALTNPYATFKISYWSNSNGPALLTSTSVLSGYAANCYVSSSGICTTLHIVKSANLESTSAAIIATYAGQSVPSLAPVTLLYKAGSLYLYASGSLVGSVADASYIPTIPALAFQGTGATRAATYFEAGIYQFPAAVPTFLPTAGNYGSPQTVTISDGTSGAVIVYCIDSANTCTPGVAYTVPITVTLGNYLRSQATAPGYAASAVASGLYSVTGGSARARTVVIW